MSGFRIIRPERVVGRLDVEEESPSDDEASPSDDNGREEEEGEVPPSDGDDVDLEGVECSGLKLTEGPELSPPFAPLLDTPSETDGSSSITIGDEAEDPGSEEAEDLGRLGPQSEWRGGSSVSSQSGSKEDSLPEPNREYQSVVVITGSLESSTLLTVVKKSSNTI